MRITVINIVKLNVRYVYFNWPLNFYSNFYFKWGLICFINLHLTLEDFFPQRILFISLPKLRHLRLIGATAF